MLSTLNTLQQIKLILNTKLLPVVRQKHKNLFTFGFLALTLNRFESLNSNAREVVENRHTAESKMYRLVSKIKFVENFYQIVKRLKLIRKNCLVNIDFSSFHPFEVLTFAAQTTKGRAIPFFFDVLRYPIRKASSQNIFIIEAIEKLKKIVGFYPRFVLDRGFMIPDLISFFAKETITFYLRIKSGKKVQVGEKRLAVRDIKQNDMIIETYGERLRLIISDKPKKDHERWYILTNDFRTKRTRIIAYYYHRFEIEESFKDLKHLQKLNKLQVKKLLTFKVLFWFCLMRIWISYLLNGICRVMRKVHPKKFLSFMRLWFERVNFDLKRRACIYLFS